MDFKVILLIRTDILDKCRDPDISKIKFASQINLSWTTGTDWYSSDLMNIIVARFRMQHEVTDFKQIWSQYFPKKIDEKDSLQYVLENTLFKPRDVLRFFSITQHYMKGLDKQLNEQDIKTILRIYSEEYFLIHMQDELTGFLQDNAINELQSVISKIGSRRFDFKTFRNEMEQHNEFAGVLAEDVLKLLFERGYIGQFRKRPDHPKEEFLFQTHINPSERYEKNDDCLLHRGLTRAFGV